MPHPLYFKVVQTIRHLETAYIKYRKSGFNYLKTFIIHAVRISLPLLGIEHSRNIVLSFLSDLRSCLLS